MWKVDTGKLNVAFRLEFMPGKFAFSRQFCQNEGVQLLRSFELFAIQIIKVFGQKTAFSRRGCFHFRSRVASPPLTKK